MTSGAASPESAKWRRPGTRVGGLKWCLAAWALSLLAAGTVAAAPVALGGGTNELFRLGFSTSMFADVNENDAKAAVKVWNQALIQDRGVPADPDPRLLSGPEAIAQAFRGGLIDGIAMQADEYVALHESVAFGTFIANVRDGQPTEEYLVLAHRDGGVGRVGDLKGRRLAILQSNKMSLASLWLETLLLQENLGPMSGFFSQIAPANKLSKVVLPVFFQKIEACVVTRRGFQAMAELNPKVGQQLKILASSPPFVTGGFYIRSTYSSPFKERLLREIEQMHLSPAGQQVLTIFQSDKLEQQPISCLDSAVELVALHRRLIGATNGVNAAKPNPPPAPAGADGVK